MPTTMGTMAKAEKQRSALSVGHIVQGMINPYLDVERRRVRLHPRTELMPADLPPQASDLEAIALVCQRALAADPDHIPYLLSNANVLSDLGKIEEAIAEYDAVVLRFPKSGDALHLRGNARARLGDYERARLDFTKSLDLVLDPAGVCIDFAWFLATCPQKGVRRPDEALKYAHEARERLLGVSSAEPDICLAVAYAGGNDFREAKACLKRAAKKAANRFQLISELLHTFDLGQSYREAFHSPVCHSVLLTSGHSKGQKREVEQKRQGPTTKQRTIGIAREALTNLRNDPKSIVEIFEGVQFSDAVRKAVLAELSGSKESASRQPLTEAQKIGVRIRRCRSDQGITQEQLAERAKMNRPDLSDIENGHHLPTNTTIDRLARALRVKREAITG